MIEGKTYYPIQIWPLGDKNLQKLKSHDGAFLRNGLFQSQILTDFDEIWRAYKEKHKNQ